MAKLCSHQASILKTFEIQPHQHHHHRHRSHKEVKIAKTTDIYIIILRSMQCVGWRKSKNFSPIPPQALTKKAIIHFVSLLRTYAGAMSDPCCMTEPQLCQKQLWRDRMLSSSVGSWIQGCGGCHSKGVTLQWGGLKEDGRTDVRIAGQKEKTGSLGTILPSSSPS